MAIWLCGYVAMWISFKVSNFKVDKSQKVRYTRIPRNVILCFDIDIGTIFAKIHSCFVIDIGLIFKILKILLNGSSSFVGARLFQNRPFFEVHICKNNIFKRWFHIFSNIF